EGTRAATAAGARSARARARTIAMRTAFLPATASACVLLLALGGRGAAQRPGRLPPTPYNGAEECKVCHTQQISAEQAGSLTFVTLTEYGIWKTLDKHAQAY